MSYCINPTCPNPADSDNINNRICRNCGSDLLIERRYLVMRLLSDKTGFGKIYEAYEGATPKILKVLKESLNKNSKAVELFQQEAIVLSQLNHPGVPKIEPGGYFLFKPKNFSDALHCIIMEKIDGLNLKEWMQQQGNNPISEKLAISWLQQLVEILHLVHQKNYFHRDIKPQNIMIRSSGQLVLIDFGTAREVTETYLEKMAEGQITTIISAGYTPPEQIHGEAVLQSDFYALGRTFLYLLTGKQLKEAQIYSQITHEFIWHSYAPYVSPKFADFIDKLMSPDLESRYQNTQEILDDLTNVSSNTFAYTNSKIQDKKVCEDPVDKSLLYSQNTTAIPPKPKKKWLLVGAITAFIGLSSYGFLQIYYHYYYEIIPSQNISLVKTITAHSGYINYLTFSPDGQTLFSASSDKNIKVWNTSTGEHIRTLTGHTSYVNYLAISPDGQILISGSADKTIKIWNLANGKEIYTLKGHSNFVNSVAITPDGQTLVSGSADKTIKIWNLVTGKEIQTINTSSYVNYIAISADGQKLISANADKTIKVWSLTTGEKIGTLKSYINDVNYLAISPDWQTITTGIGTKNIKIWHLPRIF